MCRKCSSAKDAYPKDGMYLSGFAAISCAQAQNCGRLHRAFRCFATRTFRWLIMIRSFRYLNETFVIVHISDLLYAYMSKSAVCEETIRYMNCMDLDRSLRLHAVCQSPGASMRWARWKGQPSHVVVFPGKKHEALEMRKLKPWGFEDLQILRICWSVFRGAALVPHWRALVEPWVLQTWGTCPAFTSHRHGHCQPISTGSQQDVIVQYNFTRFCSFCCVYHLVWIFRLEFITITVNQSINQVKVFLPC